MASTADVADINKSVPFSLEDIPRYPGDQMLDLPSDSKRGGKWIGTEYDTSGAIEEIANFYRDTLARTGWYLERDYITNPKARSLGFNWGDPQGKVPYWIKLTVQIHDWGRVGENKRNVNVGFLRIPDPAKIPPYPGATQLRVQYLPSQDASGDKYGYGTRITTYVTSANLSELKQFYVSSLENLGWKLVEDNSTTNNDRTYSFKYSETVFHQALVWGEVVITTAPDQSGQTRVELKVTGWSIRDDLFKEQK